MAHCLACPNYNRESAGDQLAVSFVPIPILLLKSMQGKGVRSAERKAGSLRTVYPRFFLLISIFSRRIFWFSVESGTWKRSAASV